MGPFVHLVNLYFDLSSKPSDISNFDSTIPLIARYGLLTEQVSRCEGIIGYTFTDKRQCVKALITYPNPLLETARFSGKNDRFAILGDRILDHYFCQNWYETGLSCGNGDESCSWGQFCSCFAGDWTTIRNETVGNENLAAIGEEKGLQECVVLNPGTHMVTPKVMATAVEAIIGAVFFDSGDAAVEPVLQTLGIHHQLLAVVMLTILSSR